MVDFRFWVFRSSYRLLVVCYIFSVEFVCCGGLVVMVLVGVIFGLGVGVCCAIAVFWLMCTYRCFLIVVGWVLLEVFAESLWQWFRFMVVRCWWSFYLCFLFRVFLSR